MNRMMKVGACVFGAMGAWALGAAVADQPVESQKEEAKETIRDETNVQTPQLSVVDQKLDQKAEALAAEAAEVAAIPVPACWADVDPYPGVSFNDLFTYLEWYITMNPLANVDGDGDIDFADLYLYIDAFTTVCGTVGVE